MSRGGQAVSISIAFSVIASVFVALRCVARFIVLKHAGPEDILIIVALAFSLALSVTIALR